MKLTHNEMSAAYNEYLESRNDTPRTRDRTSTPPSERDERDAAERTTYHLNNDVPV